MILLVLLLLYHTVEGLALRVCCEIQPCTVVNTPRHAANRRILGYPYYQSSTRMPPIVHSDELSTQHVLSPGASRKDICHCHACANTTYMIRHQKLPSSTHTEATVHGYESSTMVIPRMYILHRWQAVLGELRNQPLS